MKYWEINSYYRYKVKEKQQEKQTQKITKNEKVPLFTEEDMTTILHKDIEISMEERD